MTALPPEATVPTAATLEEARASSAVGAGVVVVLGAMALLARPVVVRDVADPTAVLVALFVLLGVAGLWWPLPLAPAGRPTAPPTLAPAAALGLGVAAFAMARLFAPGAPLALAAPVGPLLLNALAAVAEEAFFRRLLYGVLAARDTTVAVVGSALCFAAVHVTVWGVGALPLDLAAGLILGWQRAATGRWTVPAVTHVAANVLAIL